MENGHPRKKLTKNVKGFSYDEKIRKYIPKIKFNKKQICLGRYTKEQQAIAIRKQAVKLYNSGERNPEVYIRLRKEFKQKLKGTI